MESAVILTMLWSVAEAACAILLGFVVLRLASAGYALLAPHDAEAVPLLHVLALGAGLAAGIALLLAVPHGADFRLSRVFAADGPWSLGLTGFLLRYALPHAETLHQAVANLRAGGVVALPAAMALLLLAGGLLAALRWWRGRARLRAMAAFLLLAGSTTLLLHYAAHLLAWSLALMNFWLFAVLLFCFQRWRYAAPSAGH